MDPIEQLHEIADIGRDSQRGGYSRHLWNGADLELRQWFANRAIETGLTVETDRNANIWAWWGNPGPDAVVSGSHLDSVPGGGAFDGPLGIVSALTAAYRLREAGFAPSRPFAIVMFAEEEGSRFGVACLGSSLLSGALDPQRVLGLRDVDGTTFADAAKHAGFSVKALGRDDEALARIGLFVELHIEQGARLIELGRPVAIASSILAHGRWTLTFRGEGNHAGATPMDQRHDPMIAAARAVLEIEDAARSFAGSRATVGRIEVRPGASNSIASEVTIALDARAETDDEARALVADISARVRADEFVENSWSPEVRFDGQLNSRLLAALPADLPILPSGAGHDAGILAASVPSAMLLVRNPTGVSHSPSEHADESDCRAGAVALEDVLRSLL